MHQEDKSKKKPSSTSNKNIFDSNKNTSSTSNEIKDSNNTTSTSNSIIDSYQYYLSAASSTLTSPKKYDHMKQTTI